MNQPTGFSKRHWLAFACAGCAVACTPTGVEMPTQFAIADAVGAYSGSAADRDIAFEVVDAGGQGVPFALLQFTWDDWGSLTFQTDGLGQLVCRFDAQQLQSGMRVSALTKPDGQNLLTTTFEDATDPLIKGAVIVRR